VQRSSFRSSFRKLPKKGSQCHQQTGTAIFTTLTKNLRVVQHDPLPDLAGVTLQLPSQLVSGVTRVDKQQVAGCDINGQREELK
jgi:hypothetical protein